MNRVLVVFSDELLAQVDAARGLASRSAWIRSWCEHGVRIENEWPAVEAVAPLVPATPKRVWKGTAAEWAAFEEGAGLQPAEGTEATRKMPTLNEFDAYKAEPKPKARRKKKVEPAGVAEAMKADGWKIQRCNRGACTGTIKPSSGRCLRCNQIPLKEPK